MRKVAFIFAAFWVLSASAAEPKDTLDGRFFRLFAPMTFYHNIANKSLSIDSVQTGNDPVADAIDAAFCTAQFCTGGTYSNAASMMKSRRGVSSTMVSHWSVFFMELFRC